MTCRLPTTALPNSTSPPSGTPACVTSRRECGTGIAAGRIARDSPSVSRPAFGDGRASSIRVTLGSRGGRAGGRAGQSSRSTGLPAERPAACCVARRTHPAERPSPRSICGVCPRQATAMPCPRKFGIRRRPAEFPASAVRPGWLPQMMTMRGRPGSRAFRLVLRSASGPAFGVSLAHSDFATRGRPHGIAIARLSQQSQPFAVLTGRNARRNAPATVSRCPRIGQWCLRNRHPMNLVPSVVRTAGPREPPRSRRV